MADDKPDSSKSATPATPDPFTPRRPSFSSRHLSLQTPAPAARGSPNSILDPALGYSVAPRPRLDFARACTSLHHSTLAEQPSPESSPLASNAFPGSLPRRQLDSPIVLQPNITSSIGSSSVIDLSVPSGDDSSTTSEDEELDIGLMNIETPTALSFRQADFSPVPSSQPPLQVTSISLLRRQKAKPAGLARTTRHSSSSGSATGTLASPSPTTPPTHAAGAGNSYFAKVSGNTRRRDSLSKALNDSFMLENWNCGKSDEEKKGVPPKDPIKRVVTRRGNLLPKTKNFQRVKAALLEESSLPDIEIKREAEVTRQLREEDEAANSASTKLPPPLDLQSAETVLDEDAMSETTTPPVGPTEKPRDLGLSFTQQAQLLGFFSFDPIESVNGSPPRFPPARKNSDGDVIMNSDSPISSPVSVEIRRSKRRRTQDERFEPPNTFKRRAVSPGVSQSPILGGSPSSAPAGGGKRLNFQGMNDTNEGMMKMTL